MLEPTDVATARSTMLEPTDVATARSTMLEPADVATARSTWWSRQTWQRRADGSELRTGTDEGSRAIAAGGTGVDAVVVAGSFDVPDAVGLVGSGEEGDDQGSFLSIVEGTAGRAASLQTHLR